jgi:hypothetical protein
MSFLSSNNAEYLTARITQKGRNAIARGSFNIEYFQIGDSEFNYTGSFSNITQQKVLSPFDHESGVKYPYTLDSQKSTTYGTPIVNSITIPIRNVMGSAGFVSDYISGPTIQSEKQQITFSKISGTTDLVVLDGTYFKPNDFITLNLGALSGSTLTGYTSSLIYKVISITGNTLTLDRKMPNLVGATGNPVVILNQYQNETPTNDIFNPIDYTGQLNSWSLETIWEQSPIGTKTTDETLTGYTGNQFISTKEFLGYSSTGQTFVPLSGLSTSGITITGTSFANSFSTGSTHELVQVLPSEQRCISIIHYSELGDVTNDPERFFKYDDYISYCTKTGVNACNVKIVKDDDDLDTGDTEYFEIYIPFIKYHRNTGQTIGAKFRMDTTDYYVKSSVNSNNALLYRYLIDEQNYKVGKVFVKNKIIVFDDQELVAILDYRSNRRYTLPSPKLGSTPSDGVSEHSLLSSTGQTVWVTYMFEYTGDTKLNALPCNYFNKITGTTVPSHITMKFTGSPFSNMTSTTGTSNPFIADKLYALVQVRTDSDIPHADQWKTIDITSQINGYTGGTINPTGLTNNTFTLYLTGLTVTNFDLETSHMSGLTTNYMGTSGTTDATVFIPQFGDKQPFPGSIRLVRATDIEEMNFLVNLPSSQFNTTQNPTYVSGNKKITEVALLNSNKEPLVVAKTSIPISRTGTQVFGIKLDF